MTRTDFQNKIKKLAEGSATHCRVICRKDGSVELRRHFHQRNGGDAYTFANYMAQAFKANGIAATEIVAQRGENERAWPNKSYWVCVFKPEESDVKF